MSQFKFEFSENEKSAGFAPQLLLQLLEQANKIAHGNQSPATPISQLNYSQGIYAGYVTLIRALEEAGIQCPPK